MFQSIKSKKDLEKNKLPNHKNALVNKNNLVNH